MNTSIIFLALIMIVCFLLVIVIMVQNPKGSGLSGTFGGGGQQMGGVKKTDDFLNKSTWTLATALLVLVLLFNVSNKGGQRYRSLACWTGIPQLPFRHRLRRTLHRIMILLSLMTQEEMQIR